MIELGTRVLTDILAAFYQSFWFSVLLAVFFMFFFLYAGEHGWKESVRICFEKFKSSSYFRKVFLLVIYITTVLFRTLLGRDLLMNPLSNIMGGWWVWWEKGEIQTDAIENFLLLMPFTVLLLWTANANDVMGQKILKTGMKLGTVLWQSLKISFIFSFVIETLQLLLRLGTWQLSDLYYNSVGGMIGGLIYWIGWKVKCRTKEQRVRKRSKEKAAEVVRLTHANPEEETTNEPENMDDDMTIYISSSE